MSVSIGNIFTYATAGLFSETSSAAVYPDSAYVAQGVVYGPTGTEYEGTLGASDAGTESAFDALYKRSGRSVMFGLYGVAAVYHVSSTDADLSITLRWIPREEAVGIMEGVGIDEEQSVFAAIYAEAGHGVAQPAIGDTVTVGGVAYAVRGWTRGPGEWRLRLVRREVVQRGLGAKHVPAF